LQSPTGSRRILVDDDSDSPRYVSTGHLLSTETGRLIARSFVAGSEDPPGPAITVLEGVSTNSSGVAEYFVSDAGDLVYWPAIGAAAGLDLAFHWVDFEGNETLASSHTGHFRMPRLSPDGRQIASIVRNDEGPDDVWLLDLTRDIQSRFTNAGDNHAPTWTPDGTTLIFASNVGFTEGAARVSGGNLNLHRQVVDQGAPRELLLEDPDWEWGSSVTPDGETLVYSDRSSELEWSIWTLPLTDLESRPLIQEPGFTAKDADVS
ncbi:unnamed protein product, partial [marine sediment metagenome]